MINSVVKIVSIIDSKFVHRLVIPTVGLIYLVVSVFNPVRHSAFGSTQPFVCLGKTNHYSSQVSSGFGYRSFTMGGKLVSDFHSGVDIPLPIGTKLVAPFDGVVRYKQNTCGVGIEVVNGDYVVGYWHIMGRAVPNGIPITKGEVIAFSGNTGCSTGPHLHLYLRQNGKSLNPVEYFCQEEN
jgi:murein DD-endopeptidase MepM/ murein hydrolase activator NlpD